MDPLHTRKLTLPTVNIRTIPFLRERDGRNRPGKRIARNLKLAVSSCCIAGLSFFLIDSI
jgi:hypothetical protein